MVNESIEVWPILTKIMADYVKKVEHIPEAIKYFEAAQTAIENAGRIGGCDVGRVFLTSPKLIEEKVRFTLLKSAWKYTYEYLNIHDVASVKDRKKFKFIMINPPSFTLVNINKQFGNYILNPRFKEI